MKTSYTIIFIGLLAVLMGIGEDKTELIPSDLKLTIGLLLIAYGIYLTYKPSSKNKKTITPTKIKKRYSSIYIIIGAILIKSPRFIEPRYDLTTPKIIMYVFGFIIIIYGLILFFKEKREKKESGSIE